MFHLFRGTTDLSSDRKGSSQFSFPMVLLLQACIVVNYFILKKKDGA
jgi:hypothetical protein